MLSQNVLFVSVKVEWLSLDWWERVEWQTMTIVSVSLIISVAECCIWSVKDREGQRMCACKHCRQFFV